MRTIIRLWPFAEWTRLVTRSRVRSARRVRRRVLRVRRGSLTGSRTDYEQTKTRALQFVQQRLAELNQVYGFTYQRVSVKNQATRWGSCSTKGNLNFHYKIVLLSPLLADYILVHELCHLQELNHSRKFWQLVAKTLPHYASLRKQLRKSTRKIAGLL